MQVLEFFARVVRRVRSDVSPVTLGIAVTALAAAALYVATDTVRTLADQAARHELIAMVAAAEPSGSIVAANLAGGDAIAGLVQRGAGAFAAAFLLIGVVARGRRPVRAENPAGTYAELLSTIPFGVACWTREGSLIVCNDSYRARLNVGGADARPGTSYHEAVRGLIADGQMSILSEDSTNRLLELHRPDGTCLLIDERPLAHSGFVTLVTDVTERRRTDTLLTSIREQQRLLARRYHEEKLRAEAASRSKTAFLAHLSHDIRTPLNHIIGFADLMRQQAYGPLGDDRYAGYCDAIKSSGDRLLGFFRSILELAELEAGRKPLKHEAVDIDSLLVGLTRRFDTAARRAGVSLAAPANCGATLTGDRFALERMAGNLIDNAIRYTPRGGRVSLAAYAADDGVVIEITDTGIGMSEERLALLSQPFAFGDASLARNEPSAGLGIAIARAIAELSGGRLAIDSRPSLGTTVAVSLPLLAAEDVAIAAE